MVLLLSLTASVCTEQPTSVAPQGSALIPGLVNILIHYLDVGVECPISKFVDDTTSGGVVHPLERQEALQDNLDRLEH